MLAGVSESYACSTYYLKCISRVGVEVDEDS